MECVKKGIMRSSSTDTVCVMPIYAGHADLFPSACKATPLMQPNEVKICCPPDVLLTPDASSVWETGKSGIHARVVGAGKASSTMYVGDRGNVIGGAFVADIENPQRQRGCACDHP